MPGFALKVSLAVEAAGDSPCLVSAVDTPRLAITGLLASPGKGDKQGYYVVNYEAAVDVSEEARLLIFKSSQN